MQLRAARLCLDCEELFVGDSCPVCASVRFAFLATWLPVDERRRWRRAPSPPISRTQTRFLAWRQFWADLFGDGEPVRPPGPPRTRASDHVPSFRDPSNPADAATRPVADPRPAKGHVR